MPTQIWQTSTKTSTTTTPTTTSSDAAPDVPAALSWAPDAELPGYEFCELPLPDEVTYANEPEGSLLATLVRRNAPSRGRAILYVHGWSDYFFQAHLADEMDALDFDFYAIDLRRYGRSLREGQLAGYISDLTDYFVELDLAVAALRAEGHDQIVLMAHSTGGLIACLYANERPEQFAALVLNSPWLELQGNTFLRPAVQPVLSAAKTLAPTTPLRLSDSGLYRRSISLSEDGEWEYNLRLKGDPSFHVRVGWVAAILEGHAKVAGGLEIDCPLLVAIAEKTDFRRAWDESLKLADVVLDVDRIAARAPWLGNRVSIARFPCGMHDLVLSGEAVRAEVFKEYARFLGAYID